MQIVNVAISNYRNLDGVNITFNPTNNFIIGENDLGKSNLLHLFDTMFNRRQFSDEDFTKPDNPIEIKFSLCLSKAEKGTFDDYFNPDNNNIISITAIQEYSNLDEDINFFWMDPINSNHIEIPTSLFRKVNYVAYDSLKTPEDELTFYKGRGIGKFLHYLLNEFVVSEIQLDVDTTMAPVIEAIQSIFNRLKPLKQQGLGLYTDKENSTDFASRILKLTGIDGFDIQKSGYGIQFSTLLVLSILEKLVQLKQNKLFRQFEERRDYFTQQEYEIFYEMYSPSVEAILKPVTRMQDRKYYIDIMQLSDIDRQGLESGVIEHIKTRKRISMILGLDEPEIHLHPYMQRSLIKYICGLLENQDEDFLFLLKRYFDIDALDGQVLIVSHSPIVLLDRYEHIIRFYKENTSVKAISGSCLKLDPSIEKHLLLNFPYIKEAFFSKCAIVVEGVTESGVLPVWANKIIGDLDGYGITVIGVGGDQSVPPVVALLNHFKIPNVSIIDKDNNNDTNSEYTSIDGLRTTSCRDFEEELFEVVRSQDVNVTVLFDFLKYYGEGGLSRFAFTTRLSDIASTYNIDQTWDKTKNQYTFEEIENSKDTNLIKAMFLSWMTGRRTGKSIMLGRALGQFINKEYIPASYKQLFEDAKGKVA